jgi:hypothetical protein
MTGCRVGLRRFARDGNFTPRADAAKKDIRTIYDQYIRAQMHYRW